MNTGLQGKTAIITGGTSGIGRAAARAFRAEGCRVMVCCRSSVHLVEELNGLGDPELRAAQADVTDGDQVLRLLEETERRWGGVDIWVNNAGVGNTGAFSDLTDEQWDRVMEANLKAVVLCSTLAIPFLERRGGGCILNNSSLGGRITSTIRSVYGVAKAGVNAYTAALADALLERNIRVNGVAPGMIRTEMVARANPDLTDLDALGHSSVMHRLGRPEEIAAGLVFLASDQAKDITGQVIEITGGKCIVQDPDYSWRN